MVWLGGGVDGSALAERGLKDPYMRRGGYQPVVASYEERHEQPVVWRVVRVPR